MAKFNVGDRVRISAKDREHIRPIDGATGTINFGSSFFLDIYEVVADGPYPTAKSFYGEPYIDSGWYISSDHLTLLDESIDDAPEEESTDDATARKFKVGDVVEIIGEEREMIVRYYPDTPLPIIGRVEAVNVYYAVSLTNHELETISVEECDLQLAHPSDIVTSAKPRGRASSRSKKIDKTAINVVQVDITKAIVGDDFPARSKSDEFEAILLALIAEGVDPSQVYFTNGLETIR